MPFMSAYEEAIKRLFSEDLPGFGVARTFCLGGGKRLRPSLLLDAAAAWGADPDAAVQAAVGIELLHQYLLVHDDLMDGDELRHGQPTVQAAASAAYGAQMGVGITVLVGDYLANEAIQYFSLAGPDPATGAEIVRAATGIIRETILGQTREYVPNTDWTVEEIEGFYAYKTAAYSIRLPWIIADILAGKNAGREQAIAKAAHDLGVAYQYHDDLIEFRGEKKRGADGEGGDMARGKMTIVSRLVLDAMSDAERASLIEEWNAKMPLGAERLKALRGFATEKNIPDAIQKMIDARVTSAMSSLQRLGVADTPSVNMLLDFLKH